MYPAKDIQLHLYDSGDPVYRFHERSLGMAMFDHTPISVTRPQELGHRPQADIAVITLNKDFDNISSVQYQALYKNVPRSIDNVENFHYIPNCLIKLPSDDYHFACAKAGLKTHKSLNKTFAFLSGGKKTEITVGESAIVEYLEVEGKQGSKIIRDGGKAMVNFTQFCEVKYKICPSDFNSHSAAIPEAVEPNNIQFFNLRSSNLKAKDKIEEFSSVNILSGICLFSQEHLGYLHGESVAASNNSRTTPIKPSDNPVPLPLDRRPTLYEIESLVRLPNAIADIVSILPATTDITINLDVPRVQYYAFLLDQFSRGGCSKEHLNSWLKVIDTRHDQIAVVFEKAIEDALQRRGADRKNVQIKLGTALEDTVPFIKKIIDQGNAPSVEGLLQELLKINPLFRDYYEHLSESQQPPQNFVNLCFTSYTYQAILPVLQRVHESRSSTPNKQGKDIQNRQLLIVVDNPAEWRIYSRAEKALGEYRKKYTSVINPLILGIFPSELIFTAENTNRTSLYLRNPGQYIYDELEGKIVGPCDIVENVYGTGVTQRVVGWMRQEGMFDMSSILAMPNDEFSSSRESSGESHGTSSPATSWDSRGGSPKVLGQNFGGNVVEEMGVFSLGLS